MRNPNRLLDLGIFDLISKIESLKCVARGILNDELKYMDTLENANVVGMVHLQFIEKTDDYIIQIIRLQNRELELRLKEVAAIRGE